MKFGVLAPMPAELRPLVRRLGRPRAPADGGDGPRAYEGEVGTATVIATTAGIGRARATEATRRLLERGDVDHVVVVGVAGGVDDRLAIGDVVVPRIVLDGPTGTEYRPHPVGDAADVTPQGALHTSDELILEPGRVAALRARGVVALDMETAAVAAVCEAQRCPWSVVRAISDRSADGLVDTAILRLSRPDGTPDPRAVVRFVLRHPRRIGHLVRLGRDLRIATGAAAAEACHRLAAAAEAHD